MTVSYSIIRTSSFGGGDSVKECKLCRKIYSGAGGNICQACMKYLDDIYMTVRDYIRDQNDPKLRVEDISEALEIPVKYVQGLVDYGYLKHELPNAPMSDDDNHKNDRLTRELLQSVDILKANAARRPTTYGQERYSTKK